MTVCKRHLFAHCTTSQTTQLDTTRRLPVVGPRRLAHRCCRAMPISRADSTAMQQSVEQASATNGYIVKQLSVTADLIDSFEKETAQEEPPAALAQEPWVKQLIQTDSGGKVVFSAHGDGHSMAQHLSTGMSGDHLVGAGAGHPMSVT